MPGKPEDKFLRQIDKEEDSASIISLVKRGFDVEKVTKTFFKLFQEQDANFLKQIENIPDDAEYWLQPMVIQGRIFGNNQH